MSWFVQNSLSYVEKFCVNVLKMGPIPRHVAIIMDGNRRYARKMNCDRTDGHSAGFDKFSQTLEWCSHLGIKEVTVFAFSIENFKRSQEEVDSLLDLAKGKLRELLNEKDKLMKNGVCIRIVGKLEMLPQDLRESVAKVMLMTRRNNKAFLNIAFAYTSSEEITSTIECLVTSVRSNSIDTEDIDTSLFGKCLYTEQVQLDMLIRTSGEVRLSDFMLWQAQECCIYFANVLWPEFSIWNLLSAVFYYQRFLYCNKCKLERTVCNNPKHEALLDNLSKRKLEILESYA